MSEVLFGDRIIGKKSRRPPRRLVGKGGGWQRPSLLALKKVEWPVAGK